MKHLKPLAIALAATVAESMIAIALISHPAIAQHKPLSANSEWNAPASPADDADLSTNLFDQLPDLNVASPDSAHTTYPLSASTFIPVTDSIVPEQWAAQHASSRAERREYIQLYSTMLEVYDSMLQEQSEPHLRNNVAGAMLHMARSSSYVLTGGQPLSSAVQEGILQGFNTSLAESPQFQAHSDEEKQAIYESAVLYGSVSLLLYTQGQDQGNADLILEARGLAQYVLSDILGMSLDEIAALSSLSNLSR